MASEVSVSVDVEEATPLSERFEQLRHSLYGRWGTSAEANLLRAMQQLHTRLVTRSAQTYRRVEELSQRATAAQVSLSNTFNSLKLLSQQQFMQHRIATEDLQLRERAAAGSGSEEAEVDSSDDTASPNEALGAALPTHATREAAVRRRMCAYVEMCRESLEDEGVRVPLSPGDVAELAVDSPYTHRRLCALIGTPAFLYDADIGCRRGVHGLSVAAVQPQPARLLADGAPAAVTGLPSAPAKPLSLPGAAAEAVVSSPHAATTSAAVPPAKSAPAKKSAILSKKERQRALFSSSSSSASSLASPSAAPTPAAPPRSSLSKRSAATSARPPKSAPAKKGARYLFDSSSSSVSRSSTNRSRAEAAEHPADSPTSSSLSSSDDSSPPPAAVLRASNLSPPPPPPHALTTAPSSRAASASTHSSRVSSASLGAPTPPPPPTSSVEAAPANFAPPSAALSPPLPLPLPAAATAAADLPPPPPPVVLFDTVPDMDAPAPPPLATAAQLSPPPSTATPSRTAAVAAGAVSSLPRRGGKVLSTSSDEDAA
ncbi:hypothetical protein CUR178_03728 [Leishmania enriettii]|uniref:Uncharacterized protein n=1 Tax=Leishmania enriettii TaxID=5663 RepID=A0A836GY68_LEIEN|nr:hypothetical protein CUR178_03728 [Leishmania enriettii]